MVHEVLHAICECYNGDQSADEDQVIDHATLDRLAHGIYQVMRDNPEFVAAVTADGNIENALLSDALLTAPEIIGVARPNGADPDS